MTTLEDPVARATDSQQALRGLAHATRNITDRREIYTLLGDLAAAANSLSQSLHQIASHHDGPARRTAWVPGGSRAERTASYQVSWELHRAGEILRQVAGAIDRAHEAEGTITYVHRDFPHLVEVTATSADHGLGL